MPRFLAAGCPARRTCFNPICPSSRRQSPYADPMSRAERRRRAKEDRRVVAGGLDSGRRDTAQVMALMRVLHELLEESRDAGAVAPMMGFLHDNIRAAGRAEPRKAIACARACAHCCHAPVSARAPELLVLASAVPPAERAALAARIAELRAAAAAIDQGERSREALPCPLLRDDLCRLYESRPLTCRTAASSNAAACERALRLFLDEGIPTPEYYTRIRAGYALALAGALKHGGYAATAYELGSALAQALAWPDAEAAWLAGEPVFTGAAEDPMGDPFDHPRNRQLYLAAFAP
jgi:Fe-S-cluster containining protein